ncbi:MAG: DUF5680 domain-containing protein [Spirochaetales bacterium]|nr:DUF5680 domain-containing protein [Spirochaetales bacterium]
MSIGNRIQELRKSQSLTQEGLAEKSGVSRQSVTKWERGESLPEVEKLIRLSEIFRVTVDFLLKGQSDCTKAPDSAQRDSDQLKAFLCTAKRNTYAGGAPELEPSRPDSRDLNYGEGNLFYLDSYVGSERFSGEEVLYVDQKPYWSMNYMGRVLDNSFSGAFLKESLSALSEEEPYRGPAIYRKGDFTYHCRIKGDFEWFEGEEEIFFGERKVYQCRFHGGRVK